MKSKLLEMDVDTNVKIVVPRNACLEKYLLQKPVQHPAQRRNLRLLSAPIRNLPFGIRGRRRFRRQSLLFMGIRPDVDNVAPPPRQAVPSPSPPPTPIQHQINISHSSSPTGTSIDMSRLESSVSDTFGRLSLYSDSD